MSSLTDYYETENPKAVDLCCGCAWTGVACFPVLSVIAEVIAEGRKASLLIYPFRGAMAEKIILVSGRRAVYFSLMRIARTRVASLSHSYRRIHGFPAKTNRLTLTHYRVRARSWTA